MRHLLAVLPLVTVVAGCGGKIAPDPNAGPESAPPSQGVTPAPAPTEEVPKSAVADPTTFDQACDAVCERNGRCGAGYKLDCIDRCKAEATSRCASEAVTFTMCWARTLAPPTEESCGELAPVCEPSYCAYARCRGIASPSYCE